MHVAVYRDARAVVGIGEDQQTAAPGPAGATTALDGHPVLLDWFLVTNRNGALVHTLHGAHADLERGEVLAVALRFELLQAGDTLLQGIHIEQEVPELLALRSKHVPCVDFHLP